MERFMRWAFGNPARQLSRAEGFTYRLRDNWRAIAWWAGLMIAFITLLQFA